MATTGNDRTAWLLRPQQSLLWPLLGILGLSYFVYATNIDIAVASLFFRAPNNWPWQNTSLPQMIYQYGTLPAWLMCVGGLVVGIAAWPLHREAARCGLFLFLVVALGPGLIVNGVLKPNWHRPRPNQIVRFGGTKQYVPVLIRGQSDEDDTYKSFPCGHASMGFALGAPALLLARRHPRGAIAFLCLGLAAGMGLGMARIVQGRHFVSDVLWALVPVYLSGLFAYVVLGFHLKQDRDVHAAKDGRAQDHDGPNLLSLPLGRNYSSAPLPAGPGGVHPPVAPEPHTAAGGRR
jgi:membrane-associated PAP2 superfamily phosphatase